MKIEVLGSGCPKCAKTEKIIAQVVEKLGLDAKIEKVTDINAIIDRGVMLTPAVAIDGDVKIEGKVPTPEEVQGILTSD